jgi:hypothetical protein
MKYDFMEDFRLGREYEEKFAQYLESKGHTVIRSQEYIEGTIPQEGFDLIVEVPSPFMPEAFNSLAETYEIKRDRWMETTGNICIETYSKLKDMEDGSVQTAQGWFHTSTADWLIVFFNENEFVQIPMNHLRDVWFDNPKIWTKKEIQQQGGYSTINWLAQCTPENFPKMKLGDIRK